MHDDTCFVHMLKRCVWQMRNLVKYLLCFLVHYFKYKPCGPQQALENSGLSVVQSQSSGAPAQSQGQPTEGATTDNKKTLGQEKSAKERKRSIFRKPIQMPGRMARQSFSLSCSSHSLNSSIQTPFHCTMICLSVWLNASTLSSLCLHCIDELVDWSAGNWSDLILVIGSSYWLYITEYK